MKKKCGFLLMLYLALNCCQGVYAIDNQDVKRGMHSFMAFIYYSDPSVVDATNQRFVRSAVLIRPEWLVSTAIGPSLMGPPNGFPKETLLARTGAITIDSIFTLNEDEDEQEREIVQIVRPFNQSATQWWTTDISLMKTLLPFKMTSAVGIQPLTFKKPELIDPKACSILVYAKKYGNATEDKILRVLYVDLLPSSISNCGSHFTASTMACAANSDDNKYDEYDPQFCQGNSGGPLMCNNEVVGLQTYIENNCKQPHLYQLFFPWHNFVSCGIEEKCREELCDAICDATHKDPPKTEVRNTVTQDTARDIIAFLNVPPTTTTKTSTTESISTTSQIDTTIATAFATLTELITTVSMTENPTDVTTIKETTPTTPDTTINTIAAEATVADTTDKLTNPDQTDHLSKENQTLPSNPKPKEDNENDKNNSSNTADMRSWADDKAERSADDKHMDDMIIQRKPQVEAQLAKKPIRISNPAKKKGRRSGSPSNRTFNVFQTVFFGFIVLLCL